MIPRATSSPLSWPNFLRVRWTPWPAGNWPKSAAELVVEETQKKQEEADAARAAAQARADLLARAGKGEVTLSEMRQALIGKTRAQVSDLLGQPSETASDSWGYRQQMILNPLTNEKHGLTVYFNEGIVQSVDYDMNGGTQ